MKDLRFQRVGALSNAAVGRAFEDAVKDHYARIGIMLERNLAVPVGVGDEKKLHRFDLGSNNPAIIIECKSHTWTAGGNSPSAKMTIWNEAMYYLYASPSNYRKILFVLKHQHNGRNLAAHYIKTYSHLIPSSVELWELDLNVGTGERLR